MSAAFSQDFVQADRLIRRRYVQIPGKQKDLLERPDAWSENLSHGHRGMINVPPDVLQDVKDFHERRHSKPTQQRNLTQPAPSAGSNATPKPSRPKHPLSSPKLGQDDQDGDDEATQLSWSPSPSRPPPGSRPVQPAEQPEPELPLRNPSASQSNLLKRKNPPTPSGTGPPSSTAQSDAVPYEPLSALGEEAHPPVNRGANQFAASQSVLPAATPPSAQVEVIPSTLNNSGRGGSVAARPSHKRRRVEDIGLSDKEHETMEQPGPLPKSDSKPHSTAHHNDRNASSASVSTPSFPSQAAVEQHQRSALLQTASATDSNERSSSRFTPTYEGRPRGTLTQQKNVLRHTASGSSMAPAPAQPSVEPTRSDLGREPQAYLENTTAHRTPYEDFKAAYPDYEESTRAFIRACLAVEKLECERALPEFLYDDFVRVHSTVYMDYYGEAQIRKYNEVLKATQWYNENVKDMVYTKKIIRRDNLPAILKAHATAVRQIRESIRAAIEARPLTDDAESGEESDEDIDDGDEVHQEEPEPEGSEPEDMPESRLSPEFHIPSPGPAATTRLVVVGDGELEEVHEPAGPVPASSRMRQHTATVQEEHLDDSSQDDMAAPEGTHRLRASPELNFQEPETIPDEGIPFKEIIQVVERTPPDRKSSAPSQTQRHTPIPAESALKLSSLQSKTLVPVPSSTPSSVLGVDKVPTNDKAISPPAKQKERQSSPAFRSQAESSDDESDSFDPPVERAAMPRSRTTNGDVPAFLTQAQSVYEIPGTPDRLSEEPMPPPPPQSTAKAPTSTQTRAISGQKASVATAGTALNPDDTGSRPVPEYKMVPSRVSIGSSTVARKSPASSARSRASVPSFKRREGETKEERSKRFKEHIRKRMAGRTPSSTPASTR